MPTQTFRVRGNVLDNPAAWKRALWAFVDGPDRGSEMALARKIQEERGIGAAEARGWAERVARSNQAAIDLKGDNVGPPLSSMLKSKHLESIGPFRVQVQVKIEGRAIKRDGSGEREQMVYTVEFTPDTRPTWADVDEYARREVTPFLANYAQYDPRYRSKRGKIMEIVPISYERR